jgi:hypothetical protein
MARNTGFLDCSCTIYAEEDEAKERLLQFEYSCQDCGVDGTIIDT